MERRHRISGKEIIPVMKAVYRQLVKDLEAGLTRESEILFKVLWRFNKHRTGAPGYPEINHETVRKLLLDLEYLI
jgi:hypothetical protein